MARTVSGDIRLSQSAVVESSSERSGEYASVLILASNASRWPAVWYCRPRSAFISRLRKKPPRRGIVIRFHGECARYGPHR